MGRAKAKQQPRTRAGIPGSWGRVRRWDLALTILALMWLVVRLGIWALRRLA